MAMRGCAMLGASSSTFSGRGLAFRPAGAAAGPARAPVVSVEAKKICQLTGECGEWSVL